MFKNTLSACSIIKFQDTIYKMSSVDSGWTKLETKLKTARSFPAVSGEASGYCEQK